MNIPTFTIFIEKTPAGLFRADLKEAPGLMRVEGADLPMVYRELCCQMAFLLHEIADPKHLRVQLALEASARAHFERYWRESPLRGNRASRREGLW